MAVAWFGWSKSALALPRCPSLALVTMAAMAAMRWSEAARACGSRVPNALGKLGKP